MTLIKKPVITEKTIALADGLNQYTFEVADNANKLSAAKELTERFGVNVEDVKVQNRLGKKVSYGKYRRKETRKADRKIMVFKLKQGDKIDLFQA